MPTLMARFSCRLHNQYQKSWLKPILHCSREVSQFFQTSSEKDVDHRSAVFNFFIRNPSSMVNAGLHTLPKYLFKICL